MKIIRFEIKEKRATLYKSADSNMPLLVLNNFSDDGKNIVDELKLLGHTDFNLLNIENLNWNHDMTPWFSPPLFSSDPPCTGGADEYLQLLLSEILPRAEEEINGISPYTGIAGYSLAGLFALYAMYQCDKFARAASISGSLWFPDFTEYCFTHVPPRTPDRLYLSLGDREAITKNKILKTVRENTDALAEHFRSIGMDVTWELNPGNHFKDAAARCAKGIGALLTSPSDLSSRTPHHNPR